MTDDILVLSQEGGRQHGVDPMYTLDPACIRRYVEEIKAASGPSSSL